MEQDEPGPSGLDRKRRQRARDAVSNERTESVRKADRDRRKQSRVEESSSQR